MRLPLAINAAAAWLADAVPPRNRLALGLAAIWLCSLTFFVVVVLVMT